MNDTQLCVALELAAVAIKSGVTKTCEIYLPNDDRVYRVVKGADDKVCVTWPTLTQ